MPSAGSVRSRHRPIVRGRTHMVSAGHHHAAQAGFAILEAGGNAVDAGVAAIMALAVVQPIMANVTVFSALDSPGTFSVTVSSPGLKSDSIRIPLLPYDIAAIRLRL